MKRVMGMQDVHLELIYESRKNDADPLDFFLSRHLLSETRKEAVERVIKHTVAAEHATVQL